VVVLGALSTEIGVYSLDDLLQARPSLGSRGMIEVLRHEVVQRPLFAGVSAPPQLFDEVHR